MNISLLSLTNFRNYESLSFEPFEGLNVLAGRNAQGKSAVLEAVYLLATSKSHRTSRDMDMIKLGEDSMRAAAELKRSTRNDVTVEITLGRTEKKTVKINTVKHPKIGDIVGQLNAVIFSDSDIDMVRGEPAKRRRFLNLEISQVSPQYIYSLGRYKRVLDQRNNLLKEIRMERASIAGLDAWDAQLAVYGASVTARRADFINTLAELAESLYSTLTDSAEKLEINYKPNLNIAPGMTEQEIAEMHGLTLAAKREIDMNRATTHSGPHRDDLNIDINGMPAREFASQGQQRSAAIALKLAEIELIKEAVGENPVVMLDDVMAELDEVRRKRILDFTTSSQTLITTTHLSDINAQALQQAAVFEVEAATVRQQ
ncbi:MAG: DNA replication/repair protein RecF [Armatimonadetes bacterium]|nr:DNA replication/repair protein RecF [Armatimonadota bacterium]